MVGVTDGHMWDLGRHVGHYTHVLQTNKGRCTVGCIDILGSCSLAAPLSQSPETLMSLVDEMLV